MGLILNPSALCIFKAAVKYLTVNNMFTKKALTGLCLQRCFSGHLPLMQACYVLFPTAGMMPVLPAKDIFTALSPWPAADEVEQ